MQNKFEAQIILNSLKAGLAPLLGAEQLFVDRLVAKNFFEEKFLANATSTSGQHIVFVADFFGNGKTLFGHYLMNKALSKNFLVAKVSLNRNVNFNKPESVYNNIIEVLIDPESNYDPAFDKLLRMWIDRNSRSQIQSVIQELADICEGFSQGLSSFYNSFLTRDILGQFRALQQLKGAHAVTAARKKEEKLSDKVSKSNVFSYLKALDRWIKHIGFHGLLIIFDEVESILNLANKNLRNQAYEYICNLCDLAYKHEFSNIIAVFLLTPDLRDNVEKGIHSYRPLENYIIQKFTNFENITTLVFEELKQEDQLELATKILDLHKTAYEWDPSFKITEIFLQNYIKYFNHPLISKHTTIRRFVRQYLDILDIAMQNSDFYPHLYISELQSKLN